MPRDLEATRLYHITHVGNLPKILEAGGLFSDAAMVKNGGGSVAIAHDHIKQRRLTQYRVDCCKGRFVGEFVPFYFSPRSVMLFTINQGNTGLERGSQKSIIHLVSTVKRGCDSGRDWAIADGNAGAGYTEFSSDVAALDDLDWDAIDAKYWGGRTHRKSAEFLQADFFSWDQMIGIGCHNDEVRDQVTQMLQTSLHNPKVKTMAGWYY